MNQDKLVKHLFISLAVMGMVGYFTSHSSFIRDLNDILWLIWGCIIVYVGLWWGVNYLNI